MCANYQKVSDPKLFTSVFGTSPPSFGMGSEVFPDGVGAIVRLGTPREDGAPRVLQADAARFRFVPGFVNNLPWARATFNSRVEGIAKLRTYRRAWAEGRRCLIPVQAVYEPSYETGHPVRWRIERADGAPFAVAGIYRTWTNDEGELVFSMAMVTVNADTHPVMSRFHGPGQEKRMVAMLEPGEHLPWLDSTPEEARLLCRPWMGALATAAAPLPRRLAPAGPITGDLFS